MAVDIKVKLNLFYPGECTSRVHIIHTQVYWYGLTVSTKASEEVTKASLLVFVKEFILWNAAEIYLV